MSVSIFVEGKEYKEFLEQYLEYLQYFQHIANFVINNFLAIFHY